MTSSTQAAQYQALRTNGTRLISTPECSVIPISMHGRGSISRFGRRTPLLLVWTNWPPQTQTLERSKTSPPVADGSYISGRIEVDCTIGCRVRVDEGS